MLQVIRAKSDFECAFERSVHDSNGYTRGVIAQSLQTDQHNFVNLSKSNLWNIFWKIMCALRSRILRQKQKIDANRKQKDINKIVYSHQNLYFVETIIKFILNINHFICPEHFLVAHSVQTEAICRIFCSFGIDLSSGG